MELPRDGDVIENKSLRAALLHNLAQTKSMSEKWRKQRQSDWHRLRPRERGGEMRIVTSDTKDSSQQAQLSENGGTCTDAGQSFARSECNII